LNSRRIRAGSKHGSIEKWEVAKVPPAVRDKLLALFAAQHAEAVAIDGRRVYFVVDVLAIGDFNALPHGLQAIGFETAGVLVTPEEPACRELMKRCEPLDDQTYFYVW
jgi:hypothetical protein